MPGIEILDPDLTDTNNGFVKSPNFFLDIFSIILISFLMLLILAQLFKSLIRKQIDDQMKNIIPIKAIRKRVGIRIKWR